MTSNSMEKILNIYQKYALLIFLISCFFGVIACWIAYLLNKCTLKFPIETTIGLIAVLFFTYYDRKHKTKLKIPLSEIDTSTDLILHSNHTITRLLDIAYVAGIIALLYLIQTTEIRPLIYFIIASLTAGIIALSIFTDDNKRKLVSFLKMMIFSFITTFSIYKYHFWVGNDGWFHSAANELIVQIGSLSTPMDKEIYSPIQHIAVACTDIIANTNIFAASIITTGITSILLSIVIYCIIKLFFGNRIALTGLLLFNIGAYPIIWRILDIPTSHGVIVALVIFLLYFKQQQSKGQIKVICQILTVLFFTLLCYTHLFSTVIVWILITGIYIASIFIHKKLITPDFIVYLSISVIMFIMILINETSGLGLIVNSILRSGGGFIDETTELSDIILSINVSDPSWLHFLLNSPDIIIVVAGMIAGYMQITKLKNSESKLGNYIQYMSIPLIISVVAYILTGMTSSGMAHRFAPYLYIFTVFILVYLIYYLLNQAKFTNKLSLIIIVTFIVGLCFINLPYSEIAPENSLWVIGTSLNHPYTMTISDAAGVFTIMPFTGDKDIINADIAMGRPLQYYTYKNRADMYNTISTQIAKDKFTVTPWFDVQSVQNQYLIFREFLLYTPTYNYIFYGISNKKIQTIQLDRNYQNTLDGLFNMRFYDNGDLVWYR